MLQLGTTASLHGFVTRLNAIGPTWPAFAEDMLGYRAGRLANGYWIALLKEKLRPNHIRFGGGTQYSGGRIGLPKSTQVEDELRPRVDDLWKQQHGDKTFAAMRQTFANDPDNLTTFRRIIKLVPDSGGGDNPALDYPPGHNAPQFELVENHDFYVAAKVGPQAIAETAAMWSVSVAASTPALERRKLYIYLQELKIASS